MSSRVVKTSVFGYVFPCLESRALAFFQSHAQGALRTPEAEPDSLRAKGDVQSHKRRD